MTISSGSVENGGCLTAAKLEDIIARLEAAVGPDRESDNHIALALGWTFTKMKGDAHPYWRKPGTVYYFERHTVPHYTASIDAALTLVPEGGSLHGLYQRTMPEMGGYMWSAEVWANGRRAYRAKGRTPQGAIGAAALRAVAEHLSTLRKQRPITPPQASQEQGEE